MKIKYILFFSYIYILISGPLWSQQSLEGPRIDLSSRSWGISIIQEFGWLDGTSREIVYPNSKWNYLNPYLSLLTWQIDKLKLAGGSLSINIGNFLYLNAGFWKILYYRDKGRMEDFDWYYNNLLQWTHYSNHDTFLEYSRLYDVSLTFMHFQTTNVSLGGILGFKQKRFLWKDQTNYYIYTNVKENSEYIEEVSDLHNDEYSYPPGVEGISYDVLYSTPYLGVSFRYENYLFSIQGVATHSFFTWVNDHDHHIQRGLHFVDEFQFCQTLNMGMETRFFLSPNLFINLKADFYYIFEKSGTVYQFDSDWNFMGQSQDGGGIQLLLECFSAGLGITMH